MINQIIDKGYAVARIKHNEEILNIFKKIKKKKYKKFSKKGYSQNIANQLESKIKQNIYNYVNDIIKQNKFIKQYIFFPKILKLEVLVSTFSNSGFKNPTRAMLWHRDADDIFGHIKIIMPVGRVTKHNGMFSCLSRKNCHRLQYLRDQEFVKTLKNKSSYFKADQFRLSDKTVRNKFPKDIFDYESIGNDILFVDTNNCYHKGGRILKRGYKRHMIIITIGSITHSFNSYFFEKKFSFIKWVARTMKYYKKIILSLEIIGKKKIINI